MDRLGLLWNEQSPLIFYVYRVKSGIFGQTAKLGQRPCLFHISTIGMKMNQLCKQ